VRDDLHRLTGLCLFCSGTSYPEWVRKYGSLSAADRAVIEARITRMSAKPLMSVVMPVYNPEPAFLQEAIASVQSQIWPNWELCIADDASTDHRIPALLAQAASVDPRIRWIRREANGHISAASNTALGLARGEWIVLIDHDDRLAPEALYEMAAAAAANPTARVIYSDEDKIDERGRRSNPYFKSDLDPELLLSQNMVNHLGAYRRDLLEKIDGFRIGLEGSQDHDLVLRCLAEVGVDAFVHIPAVLYHWRQTSAPSSFSQASLDRCASASRRAVAEYLAERGIAADLVPAPLAPAYSRVVYHLPSPAPLVSVIVPTRDRAELLGPCIRGVLDRTDYPAIEVLIVDNDSIEPATHALFGTFAADPRVRILHRPGPFNYPALNNGAVQEARGEILLLLNNDTLVIEPGWLRELVSHAVRPGIGAVGAKLLYADRTIQHGGVLLGMGIGTETVAGHYGHGSAENAPGPFGWLALTRSVSAVTAACLAVKRADYLAVGGMDETNLQVAFNDVDFCLRLRAAGLRNIFTPHARMLHFESKSRGYEDTPEKQARFMSEVRFMRATWGAALESDPFWNPNMSLVDARHSIAPKPRQARSWMRAN
jgi:glycosyltransferase involved in cell wall biosynthesis